MANAITKYDDIIDSRDVIARIEELTALETRDDDETHELAALTALAAEADGSPDWIHGEGLIRDSYFKEYAQQFADDIGAINADAQWPNSCIDWDKAARELQMDFSAVEFDGITYWIR